MDGWFYFNLNENERKTRITRKNHFSHRFSSRIGLYIISFNCSTMRRFKIKDGVQLLCLVLIAVGIIAGLVELTLWLNLAFMYPLGCGLSILVILALFEIIDRSR